MYDDIDLGKICAIRVYEERQKGWMLAEPTLARIGTIRLMYGMVWYGMYVCTLTN